MDHGRPLTPRQARVLTDRITSTAEGRWALIAAAHRDLAAPALGYPSWPAYCEAEFGAKRFAIPHGQRYQVLNELKAAGMSFQDVEAAVIPGGGRAGAGPDPGSRSRPRSRPLADRLGLTPDELDLIQTILEVDDEEFRSVLAAGRSSGDLSASFVRYQCRAIVSRRDGLEANLARALRAVERAQELLGRSPLTTTGRSTANVLLKQLEDRSWDLLDDVERMQGQLEPGEPSL